MKAWIWAVCGGLASGLLFVVSLPPVSWGFLGWICLVPLIFAVQGQGFLKGFVGGIVAAMTGAFISTTPLIGPNVVVDGSLGWNYAGFGLFGMVIAFMAGFLGEVKKPQIYHACLFASLGIILELITFIRLPAHMALTQYTSRPMLALASITGIWGVSWLVWAANIGLAFLLKEKQFKEAGLGAGVLAAGSLLVAAVPFNVSKDLYFAAVQTSKFGASEIIPLNEPLRKVNPVLAVWPELSVNESDGKRISEFAASAWPVVASFHSTKEGRQQNTAAVFTGAGRSDLYAKRRPFAQEAAEIQAGTDPVVVKVVSENVGLNICFDSCYPSVMRETALRGASLIALPTLDPPSPNGFVQSVHAAFTPFRAAELGIPIIRAESTAWSMLVDRDGTILGHLPAGEEGAIARQIKPGAKWTPYRQFGDWFLYLAALSLTVFCCHSVVQKVRKSDSNTSAQPD